MADKVKLAIDETNFIKYINIIHK